MMLLKNNTLAKNLDRNVFDDGNVSKPLKMELLISLGIYGNEQLKTHKYLLSSVVREFSFANTVTLGKHRSVRTPVIPV